MGFETIDVPELPLPGQFSHVVRKGKMVFISGQTADNEGAAGNLDPYAHAERVFDYLEKAIKAAGGDLTDIVKINIIITDLDQIPAILDCLTRFLTSLLRCDHCCSELDG